MVVLIEAIGRIFELRQTGWLAVFWEIEVKGPLVGGVHGVGASEKDVFISEQCDGGPVMGSILVGLGNLAFASTTECYLDGLDLQRPKAITFQRYSARDGGARGVRARMHVDLQHSISDSTGPVTRVMIASILI